MPILELQNVSKVFLPAEDGVFDISFTVEPGELLFITGQSGAGKTTLLRLLTREYQPTRGEVQFANTPLSSIKNSKLHLHRRRIGVVFQDYRLITERNVWENVALPLMIVGEKSATIEQRVADLLTLVGLTQKALLFPTQLSGGEAQRVGIARALALAPEVVFADEPTGNLDKATSLAIARLLAKINALGTTVLLATHDPYVLAEFESHRRLHLDNGKLVSDSGSQVKPAKTSAPTKSETDPNDKKSEAAETVKKADTKTTTDKESDQSEAAVKDTTHTTADTESKKETHSPAATTDTTKKAPVSENSTSKHSPPTEAATADKHTKERKETL